MTPFSLARHGSLRKEGKSASWIIGVHKVLYSISKFYSKISPFQQPCSHGCSLTSFDSTAAQNPPLGLLAFSRFCTPFRFVYTNLTSSNFFTGRAGFDLTVSLGALAKIRKKKLWTYRFIAIRLGICVSSSLFKEYSVILHIL